MFAINLVRILSAIIAIVGSTMLIPIVTALACGETQAILAFVIPMVCSWIFFVIVALLFRKRKIELKIRTTFVVVACAWISISLFGMIPLYAGDYIKSFTDAVFESVSGFSTTGCYGCRKSSKKRQSVAVPDSLAGWNGNCCPYRCAASPFGSGRIPAYKGRNNRP